MNPMTSSPASFLADVSVNLPFFHYNGPLPEHVAGEGFLLFAAVFLGCMILLLIGLLVFAIFSARNRPAEPTLDVDSFPSSPITKGGMSNRSYAILMHLSSLLDLGIFPLGIIVPLVLWLMKRDQDRFIDLNGRNLLNFNLSMALYSLLCLPLIFVFGLGIVGLVWIGLYGLIGPIIGAIRASEGIAWEYPRTVSFIKAEAVPPSPGA